MEVEDVDGLRGGGVFIVGFGGWGEVGWGDGDVGGGEGGGEGGVWYCERWRIWGWNRDNGW